MRIASLLAAGTEMVYGLGLGESVVAISHECDYPQEALSKPRVTSAKLATNAASAEIDRAVRDHFASGQPLYMIDADLLARLKPDLIITQAQCDVCAVSERDVRALVASAEWAQGTQIVALNPTTLGEVFRDVQRVAEAAGVPERGRAYVASLETRVESIRRVASAVPMSERPQVACIEWMEPVMVAANWMPDLIELAGGRCGLTVSGAHSTYTSWDDVRTYDPQVIVVTPCGFDLSRTLAEIKVLTERDGWNELSAVRGERVYAVDGNAHFNRSGPRLVESLELLAHLMHPHLFSDPSIGNVWRRV